MRGYRRIIQDAELLLMSSEAVADFLKRRATEPRDEYSDPVDEETEAALHRRSDKLIDLALAKYAQHIETLRPLFQDSEPNSALRLAVLSNPSHWPAYINFPVQLFRRREEAAAWLVNAPRQELQALFENPAISNAFLREVLERAKPWDTVPEERLALLVTILGRNDRMRTPTDSLDGWANYTYDAVFDAAWKLAEIVEPNECWAKALSYLYEQLLPYSFSVKNPLGIVSRWRSEPANGQLAVKEAKENASGFLSNHQAVRKGLARLALTTNPDMIQGLLKSNDVALRSAAYSTGCLTPEQLQSAHKQDGQLLFEQAINNTRVWRNPRCRNVLHDIAWADGSPDHYPGLFNNLQVKMRKENPKWFERDDPDEFEEES